MGVPAIRAEDLAKRYRLGGSQARYETLRDTLAGLAARRRRRRHEARTLWALDGISFEVQEGEILGVIGRNGAGKTTLLRVLSRITEPTRGWAAVNGRVGSLLEVGTGFHPELTGRENVYLNGAILGMGRREIVAKFDEIVGFAGVEQFVDTPVKRFSSGMQVRLAFAVAAHLEPEILLVDEVLAVGDAEFQRRCLGKMESIGRSGRTVLFVSHNMQAVTRLCDRALLLHEGKAVADGRVNEVVTTYLQASFGSAALREWPPERAPGDEDARLRSVRIVNEDGEGVATSDVRERVGVELAFEILRPVTLRPQIMLTTERGEHAFNACDTHARWRSEVAPGRYVSTAWIPGNLLNEGWMAVSVFLSTPGPGRTVQHAKEMDVVAFQVTDPVEGDSAKGDWVGQWHGAVRPLLEWTVEADMAVRHGRA